PPEPGRNATSARSPSKVASSSCASQAARIMNLHRVQYVISTCGAASITSFNFQLSTFGRSLFQLSTFNIQLLRLPGVVVVGEHSGEEDHRDAQQQHAAVHDHRRAAGLACVLAIARA